MELLANPVFLALMGTLFGSAGLKIIEHWLSRAKSREDTAAKMRDELRLEIERKSKDYAADIDRVRAELNETEKQLDALREKYWALMAENYQVKAELKSALAEIQRNAQRAQKKLEEDI